MNYIELAEQLLKLGWDYPGDAQWNNLKKWASESAIYTHAEMVKLCDEAREQGRKGEE